MIKYDKYLACGLSGAISNWHRKGEGSDMQLELLVEISIRGERLKIGSRVGREIDEDNIPAVEGDITQGVLSSRGLQVIPLKFCDREGIGRHEAKPRWPMKHFVELADDEVTIKVGAAGLSGELSKAVASAFLGELLYRYGSPEPIFFKQHLLVLGVRDANAFTSHLKTIAEVGEIKQWDHLCYHLVMDEGLIFLHPRR